MAAKPSTRAWAGFFGPKAYSSGPCTFGVERSNDPEDYTLWLAMIAGPVAPLYFLILIGVGYHLATFVVME